MLKSKFRLILILRRYEIFIGAVPQEQTVCSKKKETSI
jgi:hypothetical protein